MLKERLTIYHFYSYGVTDFVAGGMDYVVLLLTLIDSARKPTLMKRMLKRLGPKCTPMKKILYIDMDNVLVEFESACPHISEEDNIKYKDRLDEIPGIFSPMEPMDGAVEAFSEFAVKFDTYILSTSPWENPSAWSDKLICVKKHLGSHAYKRPILSHRKNLNMGDYLIDDRLKNGANKFQGELIHFGSDQFPDWDAVVLFFHL